MGDISGPGNTQQVSFGAGLRSRIASVAVAIGVEKALVLTTPHQAGLGDELVDRLGPAAVGAFAGAAMHTPIDVTEKALEMLDSVGADGVVAAGGGSTIGLGKALRYRRDIKQIAVPTTYAGSECTPILGQTEDGVKTTLTDPKLRPEVVLYDAELVVSLPAPLTITSALNAMAHAAEALYAKDRTQADTELAIDGLQSFRTALPQVLSNPGDLRAREATQRGAWACGTVLGRVGMALHHKLCHTLGGSFGLPHAETHAIVLPHALAYNNAAVPELLRPVSDLFGDTEPGQALWKFAHEVGAPLALRDLGLTEMALDEAAELATKNPYWNPRPVTREGVRHLLQRAWSGVSPEP